MKILCQDFKSIKRIQTQDILCLYVRVISFKIISAQSAWAVEYTDFVFAEG